MLSDEHKDNFEIIIVQLLQDIWEDAPEEIVSERFKMLRSAVKDYQKEYPGVVVGERR
jgi:hypothetical protein